MNLSRRLWLSFGAVVALMLVMGVFAWRQMESLAELTDKLTTVRLKVEQDQLVSVVGLFGLGLVGLQGA